MSAVHFTSVHPRGDTRIRVKETASLAEAMRLGVCLYVQDGKGPERDEVSDIEIVDTGPPPKGRVQRMLLGGWRMHWTVRAARPQVAHFHDPELIPVGLALKLLGIKVVYDVHEDVPRQVLGKHWISPWLRRPVAWVAEAFDWLAGCGFDAIVAATPTIAARFPASKTITVQNFPIMEELIAPNAVPYMERPPHFAYVGGITAARGSTEMIKAISRVPDSAVRLQLAGEFSEPNLEGASRRLSGWSRVDFHGWADRATVAQLLGGVRAGLVLFLPAPNHMNAQPNKLFEYMAAGLPVIASDFPLWREIVEGAGCGVLADPLDPTAIAEAMQWILDHPEEAEAMGQRGRAAVESTYNWIPEAEKLIGLYHRILGQDVEAQSKETGYGDG